MNRICPNVSIHLGGHKLIEYNITEYTSIIVKTYVFTEILQFEQFKIKKINYKEKN